MVKGCNMNKVICDECKHEFHPGLKEKKGYQFFTCPGCGKEYPVCKITPKGLKLRKKLRTERERYKSMLRNPAVSGLDRLKQGEKVQELQKKFQKEVTPLASK